MGSGPKSSSRPWENTKYHWRLVRYLRAVIWIAPASFISAATKRRIFFWSRFFLCSLESFWHFTLEKHGGRAFSKYLGLNRFGRVLERTLLMIPRFGYSAYSDNRGRGQIPKSSFWDNCNHNFSHPQAAAPSRQVSIQIIFWSVTMVHWPAAKIDILSYFAARNNRVRISIVQSQMLKASL